jgi:hypothetical protein
LRLNHRLPGRALLLWASVVWCLTGCIATQAPTPGMTNCAGWSPIRLTAADVDALSDGGVSQIVAHNRFGAARCGWKP